MRVTVVVPAFNESERLPQAAFEDYRLEKHDVRFVFVNDGSTDATQAMLEALVSRMDASAKVIALEKNSGKAEAVRHGLVDALDADSDAVGYWDADLATSLDELSRFIEVLESKPNVEAVLGSRVKLLGRDIQRNPTRHYMGRVFATAASVVLNLPVYDTQCGAKLFRNTPALRASIAKTFSSRWIFDVELIARLLAEKQQISQPSDEMFCELPLLAWTDVKGSKLKSSDFLKASKELAAIAITYRGSLGRKTR
ncbi:MAG: glycosyltransferase [Polyangiales bacterium]